MPEPLKQDEINELTRMLAGETGRGAPAATPPPSASPAAPAPGAAPKEQTPYVVVPLEPMEPSPAAGPRKEAGMDLLGDVDVQVTVELGRAKSPVQEILKLGPGSVVPLDRLTGDALDIYVNDRLVARGEVLVVNDNFAVRITEVLPAPKAP